MGMTFSPDYVCYNGAGEGIESGRLAGEPYYVAAVAAERRFAGAPGLGRFALMAAEVHGVNGLLNRGSKPENIALTTPILFLEPPTPAGLERVLQQVSVKGSGPRKPWWRIW